MNIFVSALIGATMLAGSASAATLSIIGGSADVVPAGYDPTPDTLGLAIGDSIVGFESSTIGGGGLYLDDRAKVSFTYLGEEAGRINRAIELAGGTSLRNVAADVGKTISAVFGAGFVPFQFTSTNPGGGNFTVITNGVGGSTGLNMAFKLDGATDRVGRNGFVMFGDGVGDTDRDDMVLSVKVSAVPLPAGGLLILTALGALGAASRRRKAA
jgi:hypothetical protein